MRESLTYLQRLEFGCYQFLDHLLGRKIAYPLTQLMRKRLYKRIGTTLKKQGEGRILPIETRTDISLDEFKKEYIEKGKPVVLKGAAKHWPCVGKWSLDYFKDLHGDDEIVLLNSKHITDDYEKITLTELINDIQSGGNKYYRFYPLLSEHPEHLADFDYKWLKTAKHKKIFFEAFQAFFGGKGTESPLHNALSCNIFIQVYGRKRWTIFSPHYTAIVDPDPVRNIYRGAPFRKDDYCFNPFNPDYTKPYELFKYVDMYDFTLEPGDILWNPPLWWHSVINESDSIGVGYRWVSRSYSFRKRPFYTFLDHLATQPPIWKGYKLSKKDTNLMHLAEDGRLKDYLEENNLSNPNK